MPDNMVQYSLNADISRRLTPGETHLAYAVFGPALDTRRVRVHNYRYLPWQGKGIAMTPNGEVYFRADDYKADFSHIKSDAAWLIHELTHAWQYQHGRSVRIRGLIEQAQDLLGHSAYKYGKIDPTRGFASYKNEQQAAIVEDYFRVRQGMRLRYGSGTLAEYEAAIPFVRKTVIAQLPLRA